MPPPVPPSQRTGRPPEARSAPPPGIAIAPAITPKPPQVCWEYRSVFVDPLDPGMGLNPPGSEGWEAWGLQVITVPNPDFAETEADRQKAFAESGFPAANPHPQTIARTLALLKRRID